MTILVIPSRRGSVQLSPGASESRGGRTDANSAVAAFEPSFPGWMDGWIEVAADLESYADE